MPSASILETIKNLARKSTSSSGTARTDFRLRRIDFAATSSRRDEGQFPRILCHQDGDP